MSIRFVEEKTHNYCEIDGEKKLTFKKGYRENADKSEEILVYSPREQLSNEDFLRLSKLNFGDFPAWFGYDGPYPFENVYLLQFYMNLSKQEDSLYIVHGIDYEEWAYPFSMKNFSKTYQQKFQDIGVEATIDNDNGYDCIINIPYNFDNKETLFGIIINYCKIAIDCYKASLAELSNEGIKNSIIKYFEFPDNYKNICSQYLIWFGEFLKNLGIEANVTTNPENKQTSLIITPKKDTESLGEIEKLFYQYLQFPYQEFLSNSSNLSMEEQYLISSLTAQVENFKTQIQMKETMIRMQLATIDQLQEHNNTQKLLITSLQGKPEDIISIGNGAISLKNKLKLGPLEVKPKELFEKFIKK
ncbi:hypothetical protein [Thalassomonas actiniarum]|uniref:Uncharacterized protein n=1 Tax=Thalassomonas actiniarum TaxID=485447 RepID=A0AAE9YNY8_9GAMM|nr:hypothetical protein [Thalassomonas actiniarum]WDD97574.1 hypothetical protein SG35_019965 [Thalassomonas actiniarum]